MAPNGPKDPPKPHTFPADAKGYDIAADKDLIFKE